jgi:hypothetical protein
MSAELWAAFAAVAVVALAAVTVLGGTPGLPLAATGATGAARPAGLWLARGSLVLLLLLPLAAAAQRLRAERGVVTERSKGNTMVVMDVSGSISLTLSNAFARTLASLGTDDPRRRAGLVVFSDEAHTVAPPNIPARDLARFSRYFVVRPLRSSLIAHEAERVVPGLLPGMLIGASPNPWANAWPGGTRISRGLLVADRALGGTRGGTIVLVSDLQDGEDPASLGKALSRLAAHKRTLAVVGVGASAGDVAPYVSRGAVVVPHPRVTAAAIRDHAVSAGSTSGRPALRALAAVAAAIAVAALAWWRAPLPLHRPPAREGA